MPVCNPDLNALMALGRPAARRLRHAVFDLLEQGSGAERAASDILVPMDGVQMLLPARIGDFTDFFTSIHHAQRTGEMFRPAAPLAPNFKHLPVAYHGRASSVVVSGTPCVRPAGQTGAPQGQARYAPSERLDFELEVGAYVGPGNPLGETVALAAAEQQLFGLSLVNDWSARDLQRWESLPLGPFLAKSFMTTVSPWVVTLDALAPFRCAAVDRGSDAPALAPELVDDGHRQAGAIDIALQVLLRTQRMRAAQEPAVVLSQARFADQYWSLFQMLVHHTSNGCNLRSGDLFASGTVSGPRREESGCLLELTHNGEEPVALPGGESRAYLCDGDEVVLRGRCERTGFRGIGFGACAGQVLSSRPC